ncbi:uncharacterized protein G2W53_027600 [Senna tora]|uniref:Uncharacterized protein n=1 Tax=Senna tora TaxID=362788 RepID=A0A834TJJ6_9FABA|nr:uncharacterized protein G2W53_027600 [Senna tora]
MEPSSDNEQNMLMPNVGKDKNVIVEHAVVALAKAMGTRTHSETTTDQVCLDDANKQVKDDLLRQETNFDPSVERNVQKDSDGMSVGMHFLEGRRSDVGRDGSSRGKVPKITSEASNEQEYVTKENLRKLIDMKRQV